ncbi:MAG: DUF6352 family protein [Betaproteobacteria bacterium]
MPDFWPSSGYRLLTVTGDNRLQVTDDFLRMHLLRPELAPVAESCDNELRLHDALLSDPRRAVAEAGIDAVADPDMRDNFRIWLRFRNRLLAADTLEAAYAQLFQGSGVDVAPVFVHQLTQILCRHLLGANPDPLQARLAEFLFRVQRISVHDDGAVMAADDETVERFAVDGGFGSIGELLRQQRTALRTVDLDVLDATNAQSYWTRDERFDTAVSLNRGQPALDALCRVLEQWIAHFHAVKVDIRPQQAIDDRKWMWHVGLDAEASALLNDLYNEVEVDDARTARLLCLFQLDFANPADMRAALRGRPVYLAMAMDAGNCLRLKPQNLLLNLPLARAS